MLCRNKFAAILLQAAALADFFCCHPVHFATHGQLLANPADGWTANGEREHVLTILSLLRQQPQAQLRDSESRKEGKKEYSFNFQTDLILLVRTSAMFMIGETGMHIFSIQQLYCCQNQHTQYSIYSWMGQNVLLDNSHCSVIQLRVFFTVFQACIPEFMSIHFPFIAQYTQRSSKAQSLKARRRRTLVVACSRQYGFLS